MHSLLWTGYHTCSGTIQGHACVKHMHLLWLKVGNSKTLTENSHTEEHLERGTNSVEGRATGEWGAPTGERGAPIRVAPTHLAIVSSSSASTSTVSTSPSSSSAATACPLWTNNLVQTLINVRHFCPVEVQVQSESKVKQRWKITKKWNPWIEKKVL